jgi:hypothetical protein
MASLEDRARKARNAANEQFSGVSTGKTRDLVNQNAKAAGKKLTPKEEARAAKIMQTRRQNDRDRTAARAAFIAGPNSPRAKRAAAANMAAAVSGAPKKKAVSAGVKAAAKKAAASKPVKKTTK